MTNREKEIEKCPSFDGCSATICPFDPEHKNCIWYPEDGICRKNFPPGWVLIQKKIKKRTRSLDTYYNYEMLNRNCIIKGGITGIDPNRAEEEQIKSWFRNHRRKKILTEAEKDTIRAKFGVKKAIQLDLSLVGQNRQYKAVLST